MDMEKIALIRYANEGFCNYPQNHIHSFRTKIEGCYAFIEREEEVLLDYKDSYKTQNPLLVNRTGEKRNERLLPADTLVFVRNKKIERNRDKIFFNEEKDMVIIPEEPIEKVGVIGEMEFPLTMEFYVKVPLSFAKEQLNTLHAHYEWIRTQVQNPDHLSINTRVSDYCECIVTI